MVVCRLLSGGYGDRASISGRGRKVFFLLQNVNTGFGANPALYPLVIA